MDKASTFPSVMRGIIELGIWGYLGMGFLFFLPSETTEEYYLLTPRDRQRERERVREKQRERER